MSVHKAISKHVNGQNEIIREFADLDRQREAYIEEALHLCKEGKAFTTDKINKVTAKMNQLSKMIENLPERKIVTTDMVKDFVKKG